MYCDRNRELLESPSLIVLSCSKFGPQTIHLSPSIISISIYALAAYRTQSTCYRTHWLCPNQLHYIVKRRWSFTFTHVAYYCLSPLLLFVMNLAVYLSSPLKQIFAPRRVLYFIIYCTLALENRYGIRSPTVTQSYIPNGPRFVKSSEEQRSDESE